MHAKTLILAASLTLLATAPAAWAQYPREAEQGYDYNYLDAGQMERVMEVAHEIDNTASYMSRMAERMNRRPNSRENQVVVDLHELRDRARHFHRETESYRQNPQHTADDFQVLVDSYYSASQSLRSIRRRPYLDRAMSHVANLLNELTPFYGVDYLQAPSDNGYGDRDDDYGHRRHGEYRPPVR